ncbi:uncharacterized protein FIBRA_01999 [Fibroporia radiculosa]|uniref:Cysteine protease n=1 Tax=Fibroporia radiculosa TaxID=599839 RepID=J4H1L1_9APHY|nr:uncharacterized protein FIBRA_01999 [Fibroporia radiculosa]CCL99974.1 predicted protein [Fibroporia radiculosa]
MSSKPSRLVSSPSPTHHTPKLPRFLQKQTRDRSKSLADPSGSTSSTASSSSSGSNPVPDTPTDQKGIKKSFRGKEREEKRRQSQDDDSLVGDDNTGDEPPIIVEPVNIPRPRTRSERPLSENAFPQVAFYPSSSSSRLSDLPTRLSGWFSHTFSSSSTDLSLPSLLTQQHVASTTTGSPRAKGSALLTAARHGKGHLDKAMRYLLDSDATPDKCAEPIWLLGVEHPGYEPTPPPTASALALSASAGGGGLGRRGSVESRKSPSSLRSSASSSPVAPNSPISFDPSLTQSQPSPSSAHPKDPSKNWPPVFYSDFTSRIWLTYRSQFEPIRDTSLSALNYDMDERAAPTSSPQPKRWNWGLGGEKGWTSDSGWGCMLRTGQSLLANALLHLHLGRDWRRPPYPIYTADFATYVQIISWFLDDPSPLCPFSVHRMALVGKELGKDVGQWFGPSTAAGAIKTLVHAFPEAGLGVSVAVDGVIYQSDVYAVSRSTMGLGSPRKHGRPSWGDRAVLVLIGIRLGIDGVNPIYYDLIKALYTLPQTLGIAGGRPSSSYYFVGSQANNLFYLDPHHARPTIPLRPPPRDSPSPGGRDPADRQMSPDTPYSSDRERERERAPRKGLHFRSPTTPSSGRSSGASSFSNRSPAAPSPLQQQVSSSSSASMSQSSTQSHMRWQSSSALPDDSEMDSRELGLGADLDPLQRHYATAYSATELKTFHCDRVRKMPLSGLDPSMLIGFLCKDENDWIDLRRRLTELFNTHKRHIFSIQDEPPNWPSDSEDNIGLESISEPDIDLPEEDDELSDPRSTSASPDASMQGTGSKSELDTEDDPIDPVTPGAGKSSFEIPEQTKSEPEPDDPIDFDDEEDEEWMDPAPYPPTTPDVESAPPLIPHQQLQAPPIAVSNSTDSTLSTASTGSGKKRKKSRKGTLKNKASPPQAQTPVQFPFPATSPAEELPVEVAAGNSGSKRVPQMRTAKARDGGRTQSGGVRGVPADDIDDDC